MQKQRALKRKSNKEKAINLGSVDGNAVLSAPPGDLKRTISALKLLKISQARCLVSPMYRCRVARRSEVFLPSKYELVGHKHALAHIR